MGTLNAFYVRGDQSAAGAIREAFPKAALMSTPGFIGVEMRALDFEPPEAKLADLSARLHTDVIWLGFQSTVDAFLFFHWQDGQMVRALVYGANEDERTWERVEGEPEEWERPIFFSEEELEIAIGEEADDAEEVRRIWRTAEILPGRTLPSLDSRECARQIAQHYGLPHYDDGGTPVP